MHLLVCLQLPQGKLLPANATRIQSDIAASGNLSEWGLLRTYTAAQAMNSTLISLSQKVAAEL